jgi:hypothetical protein
MNEPAIRSILERWLIEPTPSVFVTSSTAVLGDNSCAVKQLWPRRGPEINSHPLAGQAPGGTMLFFRALKLR